MQSKNGNDKIDIKISVPKDIAKVLHTNVSYLVDGDENEIAPEIMQVDFLLFVYNIT